MLSLITSVRCVVITVAGSTTVYPRNDASSRSDSSTHIAGSPNVGSVVSSPLRVIGSPRGSMIKQVVRPQVAVSGLGFFHPHDIGVRRQLHVVEDAYRRHDKAHLARQLAPQRLDLVGEAIAARIVDQRQLARSPVRAAVRRALALS